MNGPLEVVTQDYVCGVCEGRNPKCMTCGGRGYVSADPKLLTCETCGNKQPDMGKNIACEECGARMPE